jgi:hypothetical protein
MTKDEALKLALEALGWTDEWRPQGLKEEAITAIKEALANEALDKMAENARELGLDYEPEQPKVRTGNCLRVGVCASEGHKIQPQRTWIGLKDKEIEEIWKIAMFTDYGIGAELSNQPFVHYAKAIEAKLRSKNS